MTSGTWNACQPPLELLHPLYLDTDMSMAFAAALSGGVALEREEVEHDGRESANLRNLRGNLRALSVFGFEGGRESKLSESAALESRLVRQHTASSIFIALHDELRATGRIKSEVLNALAIGDIVSLELGPAVAPLRRVVDQIVRLLDLTTAVAIDGSGATDASQNRQQRRQEGRRGHGHEQESTGGSEIQRIRTLFAALQSDLASSNVVDVVINRNDAPAVLLTLDQRFLTDQTLELLHTSQFTVIGKVTQLWSDESDIINLHRRSVFSLVPALGQSMVWVMIGMLGAVAASFDVEDAQQSAEAVLGVRETMLRAGASDAGSDSDQDASDGGERSEITFSPDALAALMPIVTGPAIQVLPLAICA